MSEPIHGRKLRVIHPLRPISHDPVQNRFLDELRKPRIEMKMVYLTVPRTMAVGRPDKKYSTLLKDTATAVPSD